MKKTLLAALAVVGMFGLTPLTASAQDQLSQDQIVIAGGADVVALNGVDVVVSIPDRMLMDHISDALLRWETPEKIGPGLATSWKQIDDVTWEFKLREGVTFHNGEPFNAAAVKFTYDTITDPDLVSPGKSSHSYVKEVQIVDDMTVRLITKEPYPVTLPQITFMHMLPPKYIAEVGLDGYRRHPIGTGPYKFVEHVPDSHVTLERFDGHWLGQQLVKTIVYRVIKEDATRVGALLAGEVDMALNIPSELAPLIEASDNAVVKTSPSTRVYMLGFSNQDPSFPTNNLKVREAINYAIDRASLSEYLFAGTFAPASWIMPNYAEMDPFPYDPERAKQLLIEAGYPDGLDIQMDAPQGRYLKDKELAEALAGQLAEVGIRVTVNTYEFGVFTNRIFENQGNPLSLYSWSVTKGDPESHLRYVLRSDGTWAQFSDAKLDEMIDAINVEMDGDKRVQLIKDLQAYQETILPVAYLMTMSDSYGVSPKLSWWTPRPDERIYLFEDNRQK